MPNIAYREFIKRVMLEANLKGQSAERVRAAMKAAAVAWQSYRAVERRVSPSIDQIAKRILGL